VFLFEKELVSMACKTSYNGVPFEIEKTAKLKDEKHKVKNPTLDRARRVLTVLQEKH
jgi:hypothetical protein